MCNVNKLEKVKQLIGDSSHFVSVTFIKKDKSERTITFNKRTRKGIRDPEGVSEAAKKALDTSKSRHPNLIRVFDSQLASQGTPVDDCWRMVNSDTVIKIVSDGIEHTFRQ